ncbi:MAG: hypothetical protein HC818_07890 [Synechococcaceae cyanobacterium RM1_1_27]|nr:hypothetical protein [Synechococcaceae cyanobacterium SM2_3_2]NJO86430.1 hypothetical protein [Synechococcaceae cyanobacterium RM1_1_27]
MTAPSSEPLPSAGSPQTEYQTPLPPQPPAPKPEEPGDLGSWMTRARHIFYGTASSVVEMLQDPDKRTENINKLSLDLGDLADELATKGALTEAEALQYLEQLQTIQKQQAAPAPNPSAPVTIIIQDAQDSGPSVVLDPENQVSQDDIQALMDLTRQVEALRLDLEHSRTEGHSD